MKNIIKTYDLPLLIVLTLLPIVSFTAIPFYVYYYGIVWQEPLLLIVGWFFAGTGITVGYHRLFSHKSFKAIPAIEWIYMILGSMALQNTIINWCSDHRRHHRKLDTNEDPYSVKEGLLHAHIGWIVKKNNTNISGVSDLEKKSAIKFQNKFYWPIALFLSFILPLLIGFIYNRPIGGLLWGGFLRVTLVHHFTFFINSLCHYFGKREYDYNTSARDSWVMAFLTFGEGFHNYHHKFQWDYRNGIKWYNFDPSKWIIKFLSIFKLVYKLRKASEASILKAKIETLLNRINHCSIAKLNNSYLQKINLIKLNAFKKIDLLKDLELKYSYAKKYKLNSSQYLKKKRIYILEIEKSISSLLLMFLNVKNLS